MHSPSGRTPGNKVTLGSELNQKLSPTVFWLFGRVGAGGESKLRKSEETIGFKT